MTLEPPHRLVVGQRVTVDGDSRGCFGEHYRSVMRLAVLHDHRHRGVDCRTETRGSSFAEFKQQEPKGDRRRVGLVFEMRNQSPCRGVSQTRQDTVRRRVAPNSVSSCGHGHVDIQGHIILEDQQIRCVLKPEVLPEVVGQRDMLVPEQEFLPETSAQSQVTQQP